MKDYYVRYCQNHVANVIFSGLQVHVTDFVRYRIMDDGPLAAWERSLLCDRCSEYDG